jgi:hypothetical protein
MTTNFQAIKDALKYGQAHSLRSDDIFRGYLFEGRNGKWDYFLSEEPNNSK